MNLRIAESAKIQKLVIKQKHKYLRYYSIISFQILQIPSIYHQLMSLPIFLMHNKNFQNGGF